MSAGVNETCIVMIPKVAQPESLKDFRPISLCNVLYKIVSKCLVNRLRPLLDEIISDNQSAFVPRRLISDNALIAFECIYHIQQERNPERTSRAYKLDLPEGYDRVDWEFRENAMRRTGFAEKWIRWIMQCFTTVNYMVKFNGKLLERF